MPNQIPPFHVAIPVDDLESCRKFYGEVLNCEEGRSSEIWVDFNLYGHQLVIHETGEKQNAHFNPVDGQAVPVPHYGVLLEWDDWQALSERLKKHDIKFAIAPYIRFEGQVGEQATMFFYDPAGNALEFKSFKDPSQIFAK